MPILRVYLSACIQCCFASGFSFGLKQCSGRKLSDYDFPSVRYSAFRPLIEICNFCNFFLTFFVQIFKIFSTKLIRWLTTFFFFGDFGPSVNRFSSVFVLAITVRLVMTPFYITAHIKGIFGLFSAETDDSDQSNACPPVLAIFKIRCSVFYRDVNQMALFYSSVYVKRMTASALFTFRFRPISSSMLAFHNCITV